MLHKSANARVQPLQNQQKGNNILFYNITISQIFMKHNYILIRKSGISSSFKRLTDVCRVEVTDSTVNKLMKMEPSRCFAQPKANSICQTF